MMIDRQEFADELKLRENIRKVIKFVLEKRRDRTMNSC